MRAIPIICIILLALAGCAHTQQGAVIAPILPLTGAAAQYGQWAQQGIDLAAEQINAQGGINGEPLVIVYEDSQNDVQTAISAFQNLNTRYDLLAVFSQGSPVAVGLSDYTRQADVLQMDVGSTTPLYRSENDSTFRTSATATLFGRAQAQLIYEQEDRTLAILAVNDDYGNEMVRVLTQRFTELGGEVIAVEQYASEETDMRAQITKILSEEPQAIALVGRLSNVPYAIKQLDELGNTAQIYSESYSIQGQATLDIAGEAANGALYVAPEYDPQANQNAQGFYERFMQEYEEEPTQISAQAYDGTIAVAQAAQGCEKTACIVENLNAIEFEGVSGTISYDETGDIAQTETKTMIIQDQKFEEY